MHTKEMSEHDGTFGNKRPSPHRCRKPGCGGAMTYEVWESSCGGYEDEKHTCSKCGHGFWVEGPDS